MTRLTLAKLDAVAEQAAAKHARWKSMLMVCAGTGCVSAKSLPLRDAFRRELERRGLQDEIRVVATGCNGFCAHGPICVVQPEGVFYERLKPEAVPELIEAHFVRRQPLAEYVFHADGDKPVPPGLRAACAPGTSAGGNSRVSPARASRRSSARRRAP